MKTLLALSASFLSMLFISHSSNKGNKVDTVDIGINVSDTARSLAFYTEILGMKRIGTWHGSKELVAAAEVNSGRAFDIIDLNLQCDGYLLKYKLNHTVDNFAIKVGNETPVFTFEKVGSAYLTINVENIDPFLKKIMERNIPFKLVTLPNGPRVVLLHDPDGVLVEISGK